MPRITDNVRSRKRGRRKKKKKGGAALSYRGGKLRVSDSDLLFGADEGDETTEFLVCGTLDIPLRSEAAGEDGDD